MARVSFAEAHRRPSQAARWLEWDVSVICPTLYIISGPASFRLDASCYIRAYSH